MDTMEENSAIDKLLSEYGKAVNASDISKAVALYTRDGMIMPQGAPLAKGEEQLRAAYEGLFKAFQLNVEYATDEVNLNGDHAFARTHSKGTTLVRDSGETVPVDNKEVFELLKVSGDWKVSHYIFNNNKMK